MFSDDSREVMLGFVLTCFYLFFPDSLSRWSSWYTKAVKKINREEDISMYNQGLTKSGSTTMYGMAQ